MVMTAMFGLGLALSNVKSIFKPFLLYAVIGGIPVYWFQKSRLYSYLHCSLSLDSVARREQAV